MSWHCSAIKHGVTVYADGTISPCCKISNNYRKPIAALADPDRFADLSGDLPPPECYECTETESYGQQSYRTQFNAMCTTDSGIQFLDIRNTNHCNLKCRYCGPHYSSSWETVADSTTINKQDITGFTDTLITNSLHWIYFTGGEPFINGEHWDILQKLVESGQATNISLVYNTNLTSLIYKKINIFDLWKQFKEVKVLASIDAMGPPLEAIRSGCSWAKIKQNLESLVAVPGVTVSLTPVVNLMNIWFLPELCAYADTLGLEVNPIILNGPDFLSLGALPKDMVSDALAKTKELGSMKSISKQYVDRIEMEIRNNDYAALFPHAVAHILLLDKMRGESLFDLLPFKTSAYNIIIGQNGF